MKAVETGFWCCQGSCNSGGYGEKNDNRGFVIYSMAVAFAGDLGIPPKNVIA